MKSTVAVQVDTDTMLRLISHLKVRGGAQDVSEAARRPRSALYLRNPGRRVPASRRGWGLTGAPQIPLRLEDVAFN